MVQMVHVRSTGCVSIFERCLLPVLPGSIPAAWYEKATYATIHWDPCTVFC